MDKTENPFLATLRLPVKNAPILVYIVILAHIISLLLPWFTGLSLFIKVILDIAVVISCYFYIYQFFRKKKWVRELILGSEDNWQLKLESGEVHDAILGASLFIHPWLTIISLVYGYKREYFIFTPENLDADQFRRLRVRLRFQVGE